MSGVLPLLPIYALMVWTGKIQLLPPFGYRLLKDGFTFSVQTWHIFTVTLIIHHGRVDNYETFLLRAMVSNRVRFHKRSKFSKLHKSNRQKAHQDHQPNRQNFNETLPCVYNVRVKCKHTLA
jgi:ribosomal protein L21